MLSLPWNPSSLAGPLLAHHAARRLPAFLGEVACLSPVGLPCPLTEENRQEALITVEPPAGLGWSAAPSLLPTLGLYLPLTLPAWKPFKDTALREVKQDWGLLDGAHDWTQEGYCINLEGSAGQGGDPLPSRLPMTSPRSNSLFIKPRSSSLKHLPPSLVLPAPPLQEPVCEHASLPGLLSPQTFTSQVTLSVRPISPSGSPIMLGFPSNTYPNLEVCLFCLRICHHSPHPDASIRGPCLPRIPHHNPLCLQPSFTRDRRHTRFHKAHVKPESITPCSQIMCTWCADTTTITSHLFFISFGTLTFLGRGLVKHKWKITQDDRTRKNDYFLNTSKELDALQCFRLFTFRGHLLKKEK